MSRTLDPSSIEALTFDCYGTLIDWLGGMRAAMAAIPSLSGADLGQLACDREEVEAEVEAGPFQTYDRVLAESLRRAAARQGRDVSAREATAFADSVGDWPPFPDSRAALQRLSGRFRLAILSNVQPEALARSIEQLGAPFDVTVTAGELGSYKPALPHFDEGLARLGLPAERVLHCANSLFHDIEPALALGWNAAWVNREDRPPPDGVGPHLVVPDLDGLASALGC